MTCVGFPSSSKYTHTPSVSGISQTFPYFSNDGFLHLSRLIPRVNGRGFIYHTSSDVSSTFFMPQQVNNYGCVKGFVLGALNISVDCTDGGVVPMTSINQSTLVVNPLVGPGLDASIHRI